MPKRKKMKTTLNKKKDERWIELCNMRQKGCIQNWSEKNQSEYKKSKWGAWWINANDEKKILKSILLVMDGLYAQRCAWYFIHFFFFVPFLQQIVNICGSSVHSVPIVIVSAAIYWIGWTKEQKRIFSPSSYELCVLNLSVFLVMAIHWWLNRIQTD